MAKTDDDLIIEARKRWTKCADAEKAQRERMVEAKKFRALDQWPEAVKAAREGGTGQTLPGASPMPPRPCLVVDRLSQPVRQVSNTIKNADFGFDVLPNGNGADRETADIFKGYLRRVHNQARGESPIEWAADGAIEGGIGWFRLRTEFVHESWPGAPTDPEAYDQELRMERITNNLTVYCDPSAMRPTRSDAQYMFVVEDMDRDEFLDTYDADARGLEEFQSTGDMVGWVGEKTIRIAEYWRVTYETTKIWLAEDGTGGEGEPPTGVTPKFSRVIRKPIVTGSKINAMGVLQKKGADKENWAWVGSRIPLIPVLGEELNVDGKPVLRGIIDMGMDAQKMVNYTYSGAMEIFALGSKSPYITPAAAIAQYKAIWDTANVYNYSHLPYDEWDDTTGKQYSKPFRESAEAPIQAAVALMRISEDAIKASTSTGDASLGNTNPNERSGKALEALQSQSDLANSNYPDNVRRALIYAAEQMVEIIPQITRPGQILHIMGMDDEPDQVMVGQPFTKGPDGVPVPAPTVSPEAAKLKTSMAKFYDLTRGRYATTVTVGKATATRQQEGARALGELIPHLPPEMAAVATPDYVKQLSFPGAQGIAENLERALPPHLQPKPKEGEAPDPAVLAQQLQQVQQQAQQMQQALQTDKVKEQAATQRETMKQQAEDQRAARSEATKLEIARMDNATKLQLEELKLRGLAMQSELDAREAALGAAQQQGAQESAQRHEAGMAAAGAAEEQAGAEEGRSHEVAMAARAAEQQREAAATEGA